MRLRPLRNWNAGSRSADARVTIGRIVRVRGDETARGDWWVEWEAGAIPFARGLNDEVDGNYVTQWWMGSVNFLLL